MEAYKIYNHIYNDTKWNRNNMKETANFIRSVYFLIMINTLFLRPSLYFTTLVDTSLLPILTSPNYTSLHFTPL